MKYLLSILCLFALSCDSDSPTAPNNDCAGVSGGTAFTDDCNQCVGGTTGLLENYLMDECGVCGGDSVVDECGVCNGDGPADNFDCDGNCVVDTDCNGDCGGDAVLDECGVCGGDGPETGHNCDGSVNLGCTDDTACNYDSDAFQDDGSCIYNDCADVCGGTAVEFCLNEDCVCIPFEDEDVVPNYENMFSTNQISNDCDNYNDEIKDFYNTDLTDYDNSYIFFEAENDNKVFISAPHSQRTYRYTNLTSCSYDIHGRDLRTGVIARILHEYTGSGIIYKNYKSDDPNYHDHIPECTLTDVFEDHVGELLPYKKKLLDYITTENTNINFVMDLHGWSRTGDVDLGTGNGETLESNISNFFPSVLEYIFTERNISFSDNHTYTGFTNETVARFIHEDITEVFENLTVDAAQFEIENEYRNCSSDRFATMIYALMEFISVANYLYETY